jgi:isopentenyl-diphosphate delta-isomerase
MENNKVVSFNDENLICVDEYDNILDYKSKSEIHKTSGILHRAFSIFIYSDTGKVLLQKRSQNKQLWPNYWSNSCCSHPRKGEKYLVAAHRRMIDELGVDAELTYQYKFIYSADYKNIGTEKELCSVYTGTITNPSLIQFNKNEIKECRWFDIEEVDAMISVNPEHFTPWFLAEWKSLNHKSLSDLSDSKVAC